MHWLRSHPFALMFAGAGIVLLVIVIAINGTRIPASSFSGTPTVSVSGGGTLQDPGISQPYATAQNAPGTAVEPAETTPSAINYTAIQSPPKQSQQQTIQTGAAPTATTEDVPLLPTTATTPDSAPDLSASNSLIQQVYALIPSTYSLSLNTPVSRTPTQQALYTYGNQAGLIVLTFENKHADMADVLKVWTEDRKDDSAAARARPIAEDMIATGDALLALPNVPASVATINQNLAHGYQRAGQALLEVLEGGSDSHVRGQMESYNATADEFTRSYVALVDFFEHNGVQFSSTDMGSTFSFSQ